MNLIITFSQPTPKKNDNNPHDDPPAGNKHNLTSDSNNNPIKPVGWVKADTKAIQAIHENVITHNPRVSVSHADQNTWNLHIKQVTEDDRGGYMCQLNTDPMKSQN
ncbi:conserved hypothetical protein [Culex quinquefasciatus]|uniref:Ig-like domain-containing protein n=1 Tax=Culex quinquefasciatus TaxID=7176 RepID=B0XE46_CULQU|nr:conserved hypothetical protein [Culex quinquefasciatus]|eukprot:XP_001867918.1 conserved hypothetical protein [Culex quinquefasciatus]